MFGAYHFYFHNFDFKVVLEACTVYKSFEYSLVHEKFVIPSKALSLSRSVSTKYLNEYLPTNGLMYKINTSLVKDGPKPFVLICYVLISIVYKCWW